MEGTNSGSLCFEVLLGLCNPLAFWRRVLEQPVWDNFQEDVWGLSRLRLVGQTDPSRAGAGAVPELVKGTACGSHFRTIGQMTESGKSPGGRERAGRGWRALSRDV